MHVVTIIMTTSNEIMIPTDIFKRILLCCNEDVMLKNIPCMSCNFTLKDVRFKYFNTDEYADEPLFIFVDNITNSSRFKYFVDRTGSIYHLYDDEAIEGVFCFHSKSRVKLVNNLNYTANIRFNYNSDLSYENAMFQANFDKPGLSYYSIYLSKIRKEIG